MTYNPNINLVLVKDDSGTQYSGSRVMFMHPQKGTAELNSMLKSGILEAEPKTSEELVSVLKKVTKLPEWEKA